MKNSSIVICFMSLFLFIASLTAQAQPKDVRLAVNTWGGSSHLYVANDKFCEAKNGKVSNAFIVKTRGTGDSQLNVAGVLQPHQAYTFTVWVKAEKTTQIRLFFRKDSPNYETTAIQTVNVGGWRQLTLKGIHASAGVGSVRLAINDLNAKICVNSPTLETVSTDIIGSLVSKVPAAVVEGLKLENTGAILDSAGNMVGGGGGNFSGNGAVTAPKPASPAATTTSPSTAPDKAAPTVPVKIVSNQFFGIHVNKLGVHSAWPKFNAGVVRLWDTGTTWNNLQPVKGSFNWNSVAGRRLDMYVDYVFKNNPNAQIIYTMGMTPTWAGSKQAKNCNSTSYGYSSCTMPVRIEDWRAYVRELGTRYKGKIRLWEIWNEADYWARWSGSPEDMVTLTKVAYQELKRIDPKNQILGPNVTGSGMIFLSKFLASGGANYIDGVSIHVYVGRQPQLSMAVLRNIRQMLDNAGLEDIPLWNTETNVSCNSVLEDCLPIKANDQGVISAEDALAQGMISNAGLEIENFTFYTMEGASSAYGGAALVDGTYVNLSSLGKVYDTVKKWILNSGVIYVQAQNNGVNQLQVQRNGKVAHVFWTAGKNLYVDLSAQTDLVNYSYSSDGVIKNISNGQVLVTSTPVIVYPKGFM